MLINYLNGCIDYFRAISVTVTGKDKQLCFELISLYTKNIRKIKSKLKGLTFFTVINNKSNEELKRWFIDDEVTDGALEAYKFMKPFYFENIHKAYVYAIIYVYNFSNSVHVVHLDLSELGLINKDVYNVINNNIADEA